MSEGIVKLRAKTPRGRELVRENGPFWDVLWYNDFCIAFDGPGYYIQSRVNKDESRWIKQDGSPHFHATYSRGTGKSQLDTSSNKERAREV